jgi:hypothetical protein
VSEVRSLRPQAPLSSATGEKRVVSDAGVALTFANIEKAAN